MIAKSLEDAEVANVERSELPPFVSWKESGRKGLVSISP